MSAPYAFDVPEINVPFVSYYSSYPLWCIAGSCTREKKNSACGANFAVRYSYSTNGFPTGTSRYVLFLVCAFSPREHRGWKVLGGGVRQLRRSASRASVPFVASRNTS